VNTPEPQTTRIEIPPPPPALGEPTSWSSPTAAPTRRRRGPLGALALVLVLVAGVAAFVLTRGGDRAAATPLALAFEAGQSETYRLQMSMDGVVGSELFGEMPMQMDMTQVTTWRVVSVADDGTATIEVSVSEVSGAVNGMAIPPEAAAMPPIEMVVAPDGRIVSAGGLALGGAGQTQGFGFPGMSQLTPILPEDGRPVAPGDSWEQEFSQEFPFGKGRIEYVARSTYDRNETVDGRQAAVIVTELTVPLEFTLRFSDLIESLGSELGAAGATGVDALSDASISYGGQGAFTQTSWVDLDAKELLRMDSAGDFDLTMEFGGVPGFEGTITFDGNFTQGLERVGS
jgi:hypothetical protein